MSDWCRTSTLEWNLWWWHRKLLSIFSQNIASRSIIEQIFQTAQLPHISASFSWVKCHQDNNTDLNKLPLKAQLNIKLINTLGVPIMSGAYPHVKMTTSHLISPLLPRCPAVLQIQSWSSTTTSQYQKAFTNLVLVRTESMAFSYNFWYCLEVSTREIHQSHL